MEMKKPGNAAATAGKREECKSPFEKARDTIAQISLNTALSRAVDKGDLAAVKNALGQGAEPNTKMSYESEFSIFHRQQDVSVLMVACELGYLEIASLLIQNGANVNAKTEGGFTALMGAVMGRQEDAETRNQLAMLREAADEGTIRMMTEILSGGISEETRRQIVLLLLENHADVNAKSDGGNTALFGAQLKGRNNLAELLIENRAE